MADQVPVNVNYAWKAVRASAFLSGDTRLAEFAMSVSGTVIVTAPASDGDDAGPRVRVLEPLALDRRVTEILMEGGGDLPVYRCDETARCLNPALGRVTVPADRGFRTRVAELLRDLVDAVRTDTAPPAEALGLVNLTTLPVYRVANTAAAYRGAVVDQEMDALAEAVALDVLQVWISDLHRTVEERAGTLDIADGDQLRRWREGLAGQPGRARPAPQRKGLERFNTALAVVEKLRLIETELAGALSADLRAALAFSRGGARRAGRAEARPMYELFTMGGGTYLVDLLNAVAAITGGGAYVALAQLSGAAGLGWILFRTAFGGSWKDNAKWILLFVAVWGAMIVPKATVRRRRPARPGARARRRRQRAGGARALRLADEPGRRRADAPHRAGVHAPRRPRLPASRADLRGAARGRRDAARGDRRGVRAESAQLRQAVRVPRPAARPRLGRRPARIHRYLEAGDRHGHTVGGRLARAHVRARHPAARRRHPGPRRSSARSSPARWAQEG